MSSEGAFIEIKSFFYPETIPDFKPASINQDQINANEFPLEEDFEYPQQRNRNQISDDENEI